MKKFVCLLLIAVLVLGCVSVASASLSAYYKDGKIYVSNSGSGMTRINMNGSSTGYVLDSNHTTVVLTPPVGATSVTISGVTDPFFGGDGGSVTVSISGGGSVTSSPVNPTQGPVTQSPVNPTGAPVNPTSAPVNPTTAPSGPSVYAGSYSNGILVVSAAGITTPSAIYVDGVPTGISIDSPGSRSISITLSPGVHTVELYTWTGVVRSSFTVGSQPSVTGTPAAHTHTWGSWSTVKGATCEGAGEETRTCLTCGQTETKRVSPLGHRYVVESETDRYINYRCTNCGKHKQEEKIVYATPTPYVGPIPTMSPNLGTAGMSAVERNGYGHILYDSLGMLVDYDAYSDVQGASTVVIEVVQENREGKPTEISLYMDKLLEEDLRNKNYTTLRYINGDAILEISLDRVNDAWFTTDETITYRVFTTDPKASGGTLVKVEAELATEDSARIQPSNTLTGIILKGATDILVAQNGVYDITR